MIKKIWDKFPPTQNQNTPYRISPSGRGFDKKMKINILIRAHKRINDLRRCVESIRTQTYKDINIIASYEDESDLGMLIDLGITDIHYVRYKRVNYFYNLYCNDLKSKVNEGWFFFLDSDDTLIDKYCVENLIPHLTNPNEAIICQFKRLVKLKPTNEQIDKREIVCGNIGMPCIVLHHSQKNISNFNDSSNSDYTFIKDVSQLIPTKFIKHILVHSLIRSHGK